MFQLGLSVLPTGVDPSVETACSAPGSPLHGARD